MIPVFKNKLFTQSLPDNITYGFYGRKGGVSSGVYDSLNCGYGSGDGVDSVLRNRMAISFDLSKNDHDVHGVYQEHSATCVFVNDTYDSGDMPRADALVTMKAGLPIGVLTADCTPVLFVANGRNGVAIGAAHAGWKGALNGVLTNTVKMLCDKGDCTPRDVLACLGPNIKQSSYEVGTDFFDTFIKDDPHNASYFDNEKAGQYYFDLTGFCIDRLTKTGVQKVVSLDEDTYTNKDDFFSYRRSTHKGETIYGRQLSAICLA